MSTYPPTPSSEKLDLHILQHNKDKKIRSVVLTAYDFPTAALISKTPVDAILVGDSVAMAVHGYKDTTHATMEMMELHVAAVARGAPKKLLIADMPFLSCSQGPAHAVACAGKLIQAGAHAVKIEGLRGLESVFEALSVAGIPVIGHLGLTPQFYLQFGGYKIQGRGQSAAEKILQEALRAQHLGLVALVLECIPTVLAEEITQSLSIPTIGIGAGPKTDGQVLVFHDAIGLSVGGRPLKFVRKYADSANYIEEAVNNFCLDVRSGSFPSLKESFES